LESTSSLKVIYGLYAFTLGFALFFFVKKHFPEYWEKKQDCAKVELPEEDNLAKLGHLLLYFICLNLSWMWVSYRITKLPLFTYCLLAFFSVALPLFILGLMFWGFLKRSGNST
jgi:hypothetical protein